MEWLKKSIERSDADFFFMASTVDFMIPHVGSGGGTDTNAAVAKDDAWTVFIEEREDLIRFFEESPSKQFFMLTGDLHNSFAINVTPNVWEFASGPANSINHVPANDEGQLSRQWNVQERSARMRYPLVGLRARGYPSARATAAHLLRRAGE